MIVKKIITSSVNPRCPVQALYFGNLFLQAYLLKNDENKALKPAALQEELNNMLKFNPDFAEAVSSIHLTLHTLLTSLPGYLLHQLCAFDSLLSIT